MDNEITQMVKLESGIDRIAELSLLTELTTEDKERPIEFPTIADQTVANTSVFNSSDSKLPHSKIPIKYVRLNDEWESYLIRYTIFYPMEDGEDHLTMESDRKGM
jgi:hypothetical protein